MKALFVSTDDLKRYSVLSGNIDSDKFIQFISIAQEMHVIEYLGTRLYEKLQNGIINDSLNADYIKLLETYVKPLTIHWALVEYMSFAPYQVTNKGVYKHISETSDSVSVEEVNSLVEKHRDIAQNYTRRFIDFMIYNQSTYPEYNQNKNDDIYPSFDSSWGGWEL
tara:strand:- start:19 stop:516 length:498 start_codon:yes stop_codon:yes gene_type:complete